MNKIQFGLKVKTFREYKKWSQSKLAEKSNLSDNTISNVETGKYHPRSDNLISICYALDVPILFLVSDNEDINEMCLDEIRKYLLIFDDRIASHIMDYIVLCSKLCNKLVNTKYNKKLIFSWYKDKKSV